MLRVLRNLRVCPEDQVSDMTQYLRIADRAEQLEVASVTEDDELACGECDAVAVAVPPLPHGKANQLEAGELTVDEMDLCVGQLAHRFSLFVAENLDFDVHGILGGSGPTALGRAWFRCVAMRSRVRDQSRGIRSGST